MSTPIMNNVKPVAANSIDFQTGPCSLGSPLRLATANRNTTPLSVIRQYPITSILLLYHRPNICQEPKGFRLQEMPLKSPCMHRELVLGALARLR